MSGLRAAFLSLLPPGLSFRDPALLWLLALVPLALMLRFFRERRGTGAIVVPTLAFVARTPSALLLANLDDLLGCRDMQNLPGTLDEHPNWRRKAPVPLEEWKAFGRSNRIAAAIRREGRGGERPGTQ